MTNGAHDEAACAARWASLVAPRTGSVREELEDDLGRYLGLSKADLQARLEHATERFADEWRERVPDGADEQAVIRFYDQSTTELFDLAAWHASDSIHYRTLTCLDIAASRGGRTMLDYGSGIGSDAIAFAAAGFEVTLADVSGPLLAFARWRCRRRGFTVHTIDLKHEAPPRQTYDAVLCFDVLEHVRRPMRLVRRIHASLRPHGLLFVHAPFGVDPERPMHLGHRDVVTPRMRMVGFHCRGDLQRRFPAWLWAPNVYERQEPGALDRVGYFVHDVLLPGAVTQHVARAYRRLVPSRYTPV